MDAATGAALADVSLAALDGDAIGAVAASRDMLAVAGEPLRAWLAVHLAAGSDGVVQPVRVAGCKTSRTWSLLFCP